MRNFKTLLDTSDELHAFAIGLCEVLCPWPARCHCEQSLKIQAEYHYYSAGRAIAVFVWLIIAKLIQEVFW